MTNQLLALATEYHDALPARIRGYLHDRGIPDLLVDFHLLGWNGARITIPIFDRAEALAFFKLARGPEDETGPKMLTPPGSHAELYGWEVLRKNPAQVIVCEGEFDRLVLEANGFLAVTSTGGAGVFRQAWAKEFETIPEVYICFDRDHAGRRGAERVGRLIPHARIIELPEEVGEAGDVTDFFVRLGHTRPDFEKLFAEAIPVVPSPEPEHVPRRTFLPAPEGRQHIERVKSAVPIEEIVGRYVKLRRSGEAFLGLCPFHEDHAPSFAVFPATGTFYCFGCQKRGDVISFVREMEHLGFAEVLDRLERVYPTLAPPAGPDEDAPEAAA